MRISLKKIALLIHRDVKAIVFSKGFILGTFIPVFILSLVTLLMVKGDQIMKKSNYEQTMPFIIGLINASPDFLQLLTERTNEFKLSNGNSKYQVLSLSIMGLPEEDIIATARKKVIRGELNAFAILQGDILNDGKCDFYLPRNYSFDIPNNISYSLTQSVRKQRLIDAGFEPKRIEFLTRGITWNQYEVVEEKLQGNKEDSRSNMFKMMIPGFCGGLLMFFLVFGSAQRLLQSILEEKSSKIIEVLLSSISPMEIFTGKIFSLYIVGLLQFSIWVVIVIAILQFKNVSVSQYVHVSYLIPYLLFLTTGYLIFAAVFATIGNMVGNEAESQPFQAVFSIICVIPIMFSTIIITQPNSLLIRGMSFIPIFTPTIMSFRMLATPIPLWEIMAITLISLLTGLLCIGLAARVFRVGMLMTGKKMTIREVLHWCFYTEKM